MSKKLIIDANAEFLIAAIQDSDTNKISNIYFNPLDNQSVVKGNIYVGCITRISPALEAMFVDYGGSRDAFLPFDSLHNPDCVHEYKIGDKILIQVVKEAKFKKGAFVTTKISISGRYLVYMPLHNQTGFKLARSLSNNKKAGQILQKLNKKATGFFIIRSACDVCQYEDVLQEQSLLKNEWEKIKESFAEVKSEKKILYSNSGIMQKIVNEYITSSISLITVAHEPIYYALKKIYKGNTKLFLYKSHKSIFKHYNISHIVDSCFMRTVKLNSGGSLTIEPTEALTSIDVNSGKFTESESLEETALKTNLEAVEEIGAQIKFRNINGIIIVDTIDMQNLENRTKVETKLQELLKEDKAKTFASKISSLGIIEISRQNIGASLYAHREVCRNCLGTNMVMSQPRYTSEICYTLNQLVKSDSKISKIQIYVPSHKKYTGMYHKKLHSLKSIKLRATKIEIQENSRFSIPDCVMIVTTKVGFFSSLYLLCNRALSRIKSFVSTCITNFKK